MRTRILLAAFVSAFILTTSCNKDENEYTPEITQEDATASAKSDAAVEDISSFVVDNFDNEFNVASKSAPLNNAIAVCPTITKTFNTPSIAPGTIITKTIDFGSTGCYVKGNIIKGKITMIFTYQPNATSHVVTYTLDNFYHNGIKIEGSKTITFTKESTVANSNLHWVFNMELNLTITLENGKLVKITGFKKREIIAGDLTKDNVSDNVYQVTGSWETVFSSGASRTATITTPLIIKMACTTPEIVKGVITFVKNDKTSTLNFGNGDCDNKATLTMNGVEYIITLKNIANNV